MKVKYFSLSLLILIISSCNSNLNTSDLNKNPMNDVNTKLSEVEIRNFNKEYSAFKTQALTQNYLKLKLEKWLASSNGTNMVKELKYIMYKAPTLYCSITSGNPSIYTSINNVVEVNQEKLNSLSFNNFISTCNPFPVTPIASTATNITHISFTANWNASSNSTGYELIIDGGQPINLGNVLSYTKTGLTANSTHSYYVRAKNNAGTSSNSNSINLTLDSDIPIAPTATAATNITQTSFNANWNFVEGATGYNLIIDGGSPISLGNVNTYSKTGLLTASNHTYYVQARNSAGTSLNSNTINIITDSAPVGEFFASSSGDESSATINDNGNFIITSSVGDVFVQGYSSNGSVSFSQKRVNTTTAGTQTYQSSAMDKNGNFVITWTDMNAADGESEGIFAQRFNSAGVAQGSEFQVNTFGTSRQMYPSVAMDENGGFVITWQSQNQDLGTTNGIYAQKFNSNGAKIIPSNCSAPTCNTSTGEFRVNTWITSNQTRPSITMNASGDFIISWDGAGSSDGSGIYFQRFNSSAVPVGAETLANTYTSGNQIFSDIAMDSNNNFAITWRTDQYNSQVDDSIIAQRFNSSGSPLGSDFMVNTYNVNAQDHPAIGMDSSGNFVIVWDSNGQDGSSFGIYGQRFNSNGSRFIPSTCNAPQCNSSTGEFRVNTTTNSVQSVPKLGMSSNGDFVVSWRSLQASAQFQTWAKRYNIGINEK